MRVKIGIAHPIFYLFYLRYLFQIELPRNSILFKNLYTVKITDAFVSMRYKRNFACVKYCKSDLLKIYLLVFKKIKFLLVGM